MLLITNTPYCIKEIAGLIPQATSILLNLNLTPEGMRTTRDVLFGRLQPGAAGRCRTTIRWRSGAEGKGTDRCASWSSRPRSITAPPPLTGWTRAHWEETFFALMKPIVDSASPGGARQRIPGPRSHHGQLADELEGFTRSMILSGPWLSTSASGAFDWQGAKVDVAEFYRRGLLAGTDPRHPEYWGDITDFAQHLVEMAALGWGLHLSRRLIWDRLAPAEQKQIADYMLQCNRVKYHQNNWLLFNVITNAVLKKLGMPYSQEHIDANLQACEHMYLGDGWYKDGKLNRIDYYNAWGFLYYYLLWAILDGDSQPAMAERHKDRTRQFVRDFRYFFSGDGSTPCFGRSMIYRFGYLSPLALGQYLGCLDIPAGEVKTMCNGALKFFAGQEILTEQRPPVDGLPAPLRGDAGALLLRRLALLGRQGLQPADDPARGSVLEGQRAAAARSTRATSPVPCPGPACCWWETRPPGTSSSINQKSYHDKPEYNDKYTKFAYSSVFSYDARTIYGNFNCDNVLQFAEDGINFRQRWAMETLHCVEGFAASKYPIHEVDPQGTIHTSILVKDDFLVNLHQIEATKAAGLQGGRLPAGLRRRPRRDRLRPGGRGRLQGRQAHLHQEARRLLPPATGHRPSPTTSTGPTCATGRAWSRCWATRPPPASPSCAWPRWFAGASARTRWPR